MIVVRNVFRLQFGKAREMHALVEEWAAQFGNTNGNLGYRMLTDLTGESYTFVLELEVESLAKYEAEQSKLFNNPSWRAFYSKVTPLVQSGYREIFTVVAVANPDRVTVAASGAAVA